MKRRPFTLVEILVAMLVLAAIVPVTLRAVMLAASLGEAAEQRRQALHLADLKLQELVVTGTWQDGEASGDFGDDYSRFRWELTTDSWTAVDVTMRRLELTVRGPARQGETVVTLSTLVPEATTP